MKKLIEKILIKLGILANEQENKICNAIDLQLEKERMIKMSEYTGTYINDDGNHYCPKCKNIILLPNAATSLCNTCSKGQYREPFKNENESKMPFSHIEMIHTCPACGLANFEPLSNTDLCRDCYKKQFKDEVFKKDENIIVPGETFINGKIYSNQELFELGVIQINENESQIINWTCPNCTYNNYGGEKCVECGYLKIEQTKIIIGINKDAFEIGKWYRIKCENGDITIAMLSRINSMHIELNCLVYVKEDDCLVSRKIEMHHCNVDAKDLQSGIVKVELLDDLINRKDD